MSHTPNYQELTFVDLFWWWWAVSANATYFFKNVVYNEIEKDVLDWFIAVQDTELIKRLKTSRVSREDFFKLDKNNIEDNILLTTWSFWNNRTSYLYWKDIERRKYLTHHIVFSQSESEYKELIKEYNDNKVATFNKYWASRTCYLKDDDRDIFSKQPNRRWYKFWANADYTRKFYSWFDIEALKEHRWSMENKKDMQLIKDVELVWNQLESLQSLESLERLQSLQRLESLERLQSLQRLESLENLQSLERLQSLQSLQSLERLQSLQRLEFKNFKIENKDYRQVELPLPQDCIIYLDPPYRGTQWYENKFNHKEFDNYVLSLKEKSYKIFISEYTLPYGEVIREKEKRWFISQKKDDRDWETNHLFSFSRITSP